MAEKRSANLIMENRCFICLRKNNLTRMTKMPDLHACSIHRAITWWTLFSACILFFPLLTCFLHYICSHDGRFDLQYFAILFCIAGFGPALTLINLSRNRRRIGPRPTAEEQKRVTAEERPSFGLALLAALALWLFGQIFGFLLLN